jgi:hypothetical protein
MATFLIKKKKALKPLSVGRALDNLIRQHELRKQKQYKEAPPQYKTVLLTGYLIQKCSFSDFFGTQGILKTLILFDDIPNESKNDISDLINILFFDTGVEKHP